MLFVILSWVVQFLLAAGLGHLALALLDRSGKVLPRGELNLFRAFWLGLGTSVALAQAYNLFRPLDGIALTAYVLLALRGMPLLVRSLWEKRSSDEAHDQRYWLRLGIFIAFAVLVVVWAAARTATVSRVLGSDTDLYHFSAVRWAKEYPAVPGLANLDYRLGINSGYFLYAALMDHGWWALRSAWILPGFLVAAAWLQWLTILFSKDHIVSLRLRLFCLLTLPYLLVLHVWISPNLYFDNPAHVLQLVLMLEFLRFHSLIFDPVKNGTSAERSTGVTLLIILTVAALGFSFKSSGAVSLAMAAGVVGVALFIPNAAAKSRMARARLAIMTGTIPAFLIIGYVARNAILSGWPLYPAPIGKLPVDWATPYCLDLYNDIKGFARLPGPEYRRALSEGFSFWFPKWFDANRSAVAIKLFWMGGAFLIALCVIKAKKRRLRRSDLMEGVWILSVALNIVFWLCSAPDFRFGNVFFWIWLSLIASLFFACGWFKPRVAKALALALFVVLMLPLRGLHFLPEQRPTLWAIGRAQPHATRLVTIQNGQTPALQVRVPVDTLTGCGAAELPCSQVTSNSLMMRKPGNLRYGFWIKAPENAPPR